MELFLSFFLNKQNIDAMGFCVFSFNTGEPN